MKLLFDAHLDLAINALEWNRDLALPIDQIREDEAGRTDLHGRGENTVTFEEMRRGGIGLCVATQIGGCMKPAGPVASWESPAQAWAMTQGQLAWYEAMTELGELTPIQNRAELEASLHHWSDPAAAAARRAPIGYLRSLEGADSIVDLSYLERAWGTGLRAIGPAHFGRGRYAMGHDETGGLNAAGRDLLKEMDRLGYILDVSHLNDACFFAALDLYSGPIWSSHTNCRALVDGPRQFSDEQIGALIERGAVMGVAFHKPMIADREEVSLSQIIPHFDHICQLAGNAKHVGIGSDLDGGFGRKDGPKDLDTIADLQKLAGLFESAGAEAEDILSGNMIRFLRGTLPR